MKNEVIFVSGQRGSGKSYWVKNHILSLPRYIVYDSMSEYNTGVRCYDIGELVDYIQKQGKGFISAIYDPLDNSDFETFCDVVMATENVYVVLEEVDTFSTPHSTPIEMATLIKRGRHHGVQIIAVTRRPAEVSRLITSQSNHFIIFGQREPTDLRYFRSTIGNAADDIPQLAPRHFIEVNFDSNTIQKKDPV